MKILDSTSIRGRWLAAVALAVLAVMAAAAAAPAGSAAPQ
jgi:hypothetical protein